MMTTEELRLRNRMADTLEQDLSTGNLCFPVKEYKFHMNNMNWVVDEWLKHFPWFEEAFKLAAAPTPEPEPAPRRESNVAIAELQQRVDRIANQQEQSDLHHDGVDIELRELLAELQQQVRAMSGRLEGHIAWHLHPSPIPEPQPAAGDEARVSGKHALDWAEVAEAVDAMCPASVEYGDLVDMAEAAVNKATELGLIPRPVSPDDPAQVQVVMDELRSVLGPGYILNGSKAKRILAALAELNGGKA